MPVLTDACEDEIKERRIAGDRSELVGRSPGGLVELGQLAVHPVNARNRHASRNQQQPRCQPIVRIRMVRRHGALVDPEEVHPRPIDNERGENGEKGGRDRSSGEPHDESFTSRENLYGLAWNSLANVR